MLKRYFLEETGITKRDFSTVFILVFNVFTYYYLTLIILNRALEGLTMAPTLWVTYYGTAFGSSIVGAVLSSKIDRCKFLNFWMVLGVVVSLLLAFFSSNMGVHAALMCFFLGVSVGLGMPSCLAYFADHTLTENRGRVSGVIFLTTNLAVFPLAISFNQFNLAVNFVICAVWRGLGLLLFFLLKPHENTIETKKHSSFISVFQNKSFVLYFTTWLMFSFIDRFEHPILKQFFGLDFHRFTRMVEPVFASFFALIGGLLSDLIGRKRVVIYGFVALGLAYGIIGIIPTIFASWYVHCVIDGAAAGILWVLFILVLWGDLSKASAGEKYYAIGSAPFFLGSIIPLILTSSITLIPASAAFSLASFFLFVAVLPLIFAPETLPEKKIELRRLRKYMEKAKKVKEKHEVKEGV